MSRQQKNAFTMHSNVQLMLRKIVATVPIGSGAICIYTKRKHIINSLIY